MLPKIQSIIAPLFTPFAPAVLLGNEMFLVMKDAGIPVLMAIICSIIGVTGLEFSGALACYMTVESWRRKSWIAMCLAIIGAGVYTTAIIWGIYQIPQQRAKVFIVFVFVTLVGYLGYALYHSFTKQDVQYAEQVDQQIQLTREQKNLTNAQARLTQWQAQTSPMFTPNTVRSGGEQGEQSKRQIAWEYLDGHGDVGVQGLARAIGCSPSTAKKHRDSWMINHS